ncbi:MAG TPA: cytochrome c [Anaerolineae bacterium]|nr:cytochrome c [Anaerolineae bacterium]
MRAYRRYHLNTLGPAFVVLAVLLATCGGNPTPRGDPERGKALFTSEAKPPCATCHTIEGVSNGQIGPNLTHIGTEAAARVSDPTYTGSAQDAEGYIRESILTPNAFIASNCPTGTCFKDIMPQDFGKSLSEQQIADLVAFLLSQQ